MIRWLAQFALVATALGTPFLPPPADPDDAALSARLAEVMKKGLGASHGAMVLVARGDTLLLHAGCGPTGAATEGATPAAIGKETVFAIGSITKLFTAAAILKLEQQGHLKTDDQLGDLLDGVPADKAAITLHQLLTHSAGLHDFHDRPGEGGDFAPLTKDEALARILDQKLLFTPGSESRYSNSGYTLLAAVVEEASGQPFVDFLRRELFVPAGMTRTGFFGEPRWKPAEVARGRGAKQHVAKAGAAGAGGVNDPMEWELTWALMGNGGIVSSAEELWKWCRALEGDAVLDAKRRAKLDQAHFPLKEGGAEGYGWMVGKTAWGALLQDVAGGDDFGFLSELWRAPKEGSNEAIVIAVTSNSAPPQGTLPRLIEELARAVHDAGKPR